MRWREFIAGLGSAAAWPLVARVQRTATPVIGFLDIGSSEKRKVALIGRFLALSATGHIMKKRRKPAFPHLA